MTEAKEVTGEDQRAEEPDGSGFDQPEGRLSRTGGRAGCDADRPPPIPAASRLKRSVEVFFGSNEKVYLLRGAIDKEYVLDDVSELDRYLLERLANGGVNRRAAEQIALNCGVTPQAVANLLGQLDELGLLEQANDVRGLGEKDLERFDRQLIYFSDLAPRGTSAVDLQRRLRASKVAILGCGGLGSWTASALACAGVGHLMLIDDDRVELSNLNRQILFGETDLGAYKVETVRAALEKLDSSLQVTPIRRRVRNPKDLVELLSGIDLVVATGDWPPYELPRWVNEACLAEEVPFITAGQFPPLIRVGPMVLPGQSACLECLERQVRRDYPMYEELAAHRAGHPQTAATVGAVSGLIGSMLAMEAIHFLLDVVQPATVNVVVTMDLQTMQLSQEALSRDLACVLCGAQAPLQRGRI